MAFTSLNPFRLNRRALPGGLGELRLVTMIAIVAGIAQWVVPVGARYALTGGRVYYSNESVWHSVLPWPVLSVPAWLTIVTGVIAIIGATAYFLRGGIRIAGDIVYVLFTLLLAYGFLPWFIAALDMDPTGGIRTPGDQGYLIGWHWVITPLCIVPIVAAVIATRRISRIRVEQRRARRVAQG